MPRLIGELAIWNVTPLDERAEYHYALWLDDDERFGRPPPRLDLDETEVEVVAARLDKPEPWVAGSVQHRRSMGWPVLLATILDDVNMERDDTR